MKIKSSKQLSQILTQIEISAQQFSSTTLLQRAKFLRSIAIHLKKNENKLVATAAKETNLLPERLKAELFRTEQQLIKYGDYCAKGEWMDIVIDTSDYSFNKSDLRKIKVPIGPVVVFGSSNFPFAYSTAGGDTASAFAAGCPVVVKAHNSHIETSRMVATLIEKAMDDNGLPKAIFKHLEIDDYQFSEQLIKSSCIKAVAFTGSEEGGMQMHKWAQERQDPIPVFAEMGSTNPVFLLPKFLESHHKKIATELHQSITGSQGQFCTKPGFIIFIKSDAAKAFENKLMELCSTNRPLKMLHNGIKDNYLKRLMENEQYAGKALLEGSNEDGYISPTIAKTSAKNFIKNKLMHQEVFGPYCLLVECKNLGEQESVVKSLGGQLTCTIWGNNKELKENIGLVNAMRNRCGRMVFNGVPTGVAIDLAMQHGGPFPATTDSRFTSVGADAIRRFARPVCYQNCPDNLLPQELKAANPLKIKRRVNGVFEV